jgi:periplasmic divalent cation tolerance protein
MTGKLSFNLEGVRVDPESLIVLCTCPDEATAERVAGALVEERLAACVNAIAGVSSTYRWQGKVERDREVLLLIKTTDSAYDRIEDRIRELHPYELPETVAVPIVRGSRAYLRWLQEAASGGASE